MIVLYKKYSKNLPTIKLMMICKIKIFDYWTLLMANLYKSSAYQQHFCFAFETDNKPCIVLQIIGLLSHVCGKLDAYIF